MKKIQQSVSVRPLILVIAGGLAFLDFTGVSLRRAEALDLVFDFRYDEPANGGNDFFGTAGSPQRIALEAAASFFEGILADDFDPIAPGGGNTWDATFFNPNNPFSPAITETDLSIAADTIFVFAGSFDLGGPGPLGLGGPGGAIISGDQDFVDSIFIRGEGGVITPFISGDDTEYATWGGSLTFNDALPWNFSVETGPGATQNDFYSVALHEIGHILGITVGDSFKAQVNGSYEFTGPNAVASFGANVPLEASNDFHWALGTSSTTYPDGDPQGAAMTPSLTTGTRRIFTDLDVAALDDIGWEVVPEPTSSLLLAFGAFFLMLRRPLRQN